MNNHGLRRFYPRHPRGWRRVWAGFVVVTTYSFYPRHPRGWRPINRIKIIIHNYVSIHATLVGGDRDATDAGDICELFLSTPPSWVATTPSSLTIRRIPCFYPRHPRGWRPSLQYHCPIHGLFLSTPPSWVATPPAARRARRHRRFYPRHPRGWRQEFCTVNLRYNDVSIPATLVGGDGFYSIAMGQNMSVSIHATLVGGDSLLPIR